MLITLIVPILSQPEVLQGTWKSGEGRFSSVGYLPYVIDDIVLVLFPISTFHPVNATSHNLFRFWVSWRSRRIPLLPRWALSLKILTPHSVFIIPSSPLTPVLLLLFSSYEPLVLQCVAIWFWFCFKDAIIFHPPPPRSWNPTRSSRPQAQLYAPKRPLGGNLAFWGGEKGDFRVYRVLPFSKIPL